MVVAVGLMTLTSKVLHVPRVLYPWPHGVPDLTVSIVSAALAGPTEELFFCVFVAVVARAGGLQFRYTVLLSVTLRVAFHIYYGWPALAMTVWAAAAITIYIVTGRIIGIIVMHSAWDLTGAALAHGWTLPYLVGVLIVYGIPIATGLRFAIAAEPGTRPRSA